MIDRETPPPFGKIESFNFPFPEYYTLSNKIKVYVLPGHFEQALRIDVCFKAGDKYHQNPIVAHAVNQLITEGTKTKNSSQIAKEFDTLGSFVDKECGADFAKITVFSLEENLNKLLYLLKEILSEAIFPKNEIDIYKNIKTQKLLVNREKSTWVASQDFKSKLFSRDHYYGKIIDESSINEFSSVDLFSFYNKFYRPENCYIIISGKVNEDVLEKLNSFLGSDAWQKEASSSDYLLPKNVSITSEKGVFNAIKEDSMQAAIKYGRVLFNRKHTDFFGMQILSTILGGYFGSRLMKNIREDKGYTYGIGCSVVSMEDTGYFVISSEVKNEVKELTIQEIEKEIVTLQEILVTNNELNLVKNYLLGSFLRLFDGVFSKADRVNIMINNKLDTEYYNHYINKINNIQAEEIQILAKKYLDKNEITKIVVG